MLHSGSCYGEKQSKDGEGGIEGYGERVTHWDGGTLTCNDGKMFCEMHIRTQTQIVQFSHSGSLNVVTKMVSMRYMELCVVIEHTVLYKLFYSLQIGICSKTMVKTILQQSHKLVTYLFIILSELGIMYNCMYVLFFYVCMFMCYMHMRVHVGVCILHTVGVYLCAHTCGSQWLMLDFFHVALHFIDFGTERFSLTLSSLTQGQAEQPMSSRDLSLPLQHWDCRHMLPCQDLYLSTRDLNSGLHACVAITFPIVLSPRPIFILLGLFTSTSLQVHEQCIELGGY